MPSLIIQTLPTSRVRKNKWYLELHTDLKKDKLIIAITCWTRLGISIWSSLSLDCFSIWLQHNDRWTFLNSNNYWKVDRCDNSQLRGSRVFLLNIPQARLHYWIIFIALSSFCWGMTAILSKYHTNKIGVKSIYRVSDPCRFCSVLSGMSCKTRHKWRPNTKGNYEFWKPPSVVLVYNKGRKIYEGSVAK